MTTALDLCDAIKAEAWKERPAPLSHYDFARTLTTPDSEDDRGNLQPYDPRSHPGQRITLRALDGAYDRPGHSFRTFVLVGDAQGAGKSWMLQVAAFHSLIERGQNLIYALPTRDLGGDIWSLKLRPAVVGAGLERFLPEIGPGSKSGSKPRFVPFQRLDGKGGGTLVFMAAGGRGQSGQAALTAKRLIVDEVDDWPKQSLQLIQKRISRWNQTAQQFYACTVNKNNTPDAEDDESNIIPLYESTVRGRIAYPCPACGKMTKLLPDRFQYGGTTEEEWKASARIACEHCSHGVTQAEREVMHASGDLEMGAPGASTWGILMTALDCPWKPLHWLAGLDYAARLAADQGNDEPTRQLHNKEWSQQYQRKRDDIAVKIDVPSLLRRSQAMPQWRTMKDTDREEGSRSYSRHIAPHPEGASVYTVAIDVQGDRVYWLLMGGDAEGRTWDRAWGYEYFDAERKEMTEAQLKSVLDRIDGLTRGMAGDFPIVDRGVDANFNTGPILDWLKTHAEWRPVYGASMKKAARMQRAGRKTRDYPGILYLRRTDEWRLKQDRCHIDTTPVRQAAQRAFLLPIGTPGAAHIPSGLSTSSSDLNYLQHLCGEQWDEQGLVWVKPKGGGRHDYLDCRTYAVALFRLWLLQRPKADAPTPAPPGGRPAGWIEPYTTPGGWEI